MDFQEEILFKDADKLQISFFTVTYDRNASGYWMTDPEAATVSMTIPHWHSMAQETLYVEEGNLTIKINNYETQISKGDLVVINGFDIHSLIGDALVRVLQFGTKLQGSIYNHFQPIFNLADEKKVIRPGMPMYQNVRDELFEARECYLKKCSNYAMIVLGCLYKFIYYVNMIDPNAAPDSTMKMQKQINYSKLSDLFEYIDQNYNQPITASQAANVMNFSLSYFCKFFKQTMGMTFFEYLNDFRCEKASVLLRSTDKSISEIAMLTGFSSSQYFSRIFKKRWGLAPSQMKKDNPREKERTVVEQ